MGQQTRNESLFYYFRLEEQIPEDNLLRLIDRHIDLSFVRDRHHTLQRLEPNCTVSHACSPIFLQSCSCSCSSDIMGSRTWRAERDFKQ